MLPDRRVASLNATLTFSKTEFRYYVRHGLLDRNLCALCLTRSHGLTIKGCWLSRINKRDPLINITGSVVRTGFEPSAAFELIAQSVYARMHWVVAGDDTSPACRESEFWGPSRILITDALINHV